MAEEPQPQVVQEGVEQPDALPASAEDRKAAQALSSLGANGGDESSSTAKKEVDLKALSDAIKKIESGDKKAADKKKADAAKKKADEPAKPLVKVDAADVTLVAEQLDMSKTRATELLRAHDASVAKAMKAWVTAAV